MLESNLEAASNTGITWKHLEATIQPRRALSIQNPQLGSQNPALEELRKQESSPEGLQITSIHA